MDTPSRTPTPPHEIDPIAESAGRHLRRAQALLTAGQRVFARLYLVLLALAFLKEADLYARDEQDRRAMKRSKANGLAAFECQNALLEAGFGLMGLDVALAGSLAAVGSLPLEEHENDRLGATVANIWLRVSNPHWTSVEAAAGGFRVAVESRLNGLAYVDAMLSFPDAARSFWSASKLCPSIEEGKAYAGKIAALFDALIAIEVKANDLAPPAPREALQTAPEAL